MAYLNATLNRNGYANWSNGHSYGTLSGPQYGPPYGPSSYSGTAFIHGTPTQSCFVSRTTDGTNRQIAFESVYDPNYPGGYRFEGHEKRYPW